MKAPADMTRAELAREAAKADNALSVILSELIAAGRGHERPSETRTKADPLSLRYVAAMNRAGELSTEERRRMEYHGSTHRIIRK